MSLDGRDYIRQSIVDALMTPLGSRVMRPSYGSRLFFLLDRLINEQTQAEAIAAIVETLVNCVSGVVPRQVVMRETGRGFALFDLTYTDEGSGETVNLNGVEVAQVV